jgi:hypothetical protein
MQNEIWKSILGYPKYEVSNMGNVRRNNKQLNLFIVKGYLSFNVIEEGKRRKSMRVHREVAKAFLGNHPDMIVRHIDGNPLNCKLSNIAWGTHRDNEEDKINHGKSLMGSNNHRAKITEKDAIFIKQSEMTAKELTKKFNIGYRSIWAIKTGRTWKHLRA